MESCNTINMFVLIAITVTFVMSMRQSTNNNEMFCNVCLLLLGVVVIWKMSDGKLENFTFEVTPWKKTCSTDNPSPNCCGKQFVGGGKPHFEYASDAERLQCKQPVGGYIQAGDVQTERSQQLLQSNSFSDTLAKAYGAEDTVETFISGGDCGCY